MKSVPLLLLPILALFSGGGAVFVLPEFSVFDSNGDGRAEAAEIGGGLLELLGHGIVARVDRPPFDGAVDRLEYEQLKRAVQHGYQQIGQQWLDALQREFGQQQ